MNISAPTPANAALSPTTMATPPLNFHRLLTPAEHKDFHFASLSDLRLAIDNIQKEQIRKQQLRNLTRIEPFISAMEEYGKVIEVFLNTTNILAFVWGPMKFILQTVRNYLDAFDLMVDIYKEFGECLPLFLQYEALFRKHSHMLKVLEYVYEDILDFHKYSLKFFRKPAWHQLFPYTSKKLFDLCRTVANNLQRHKSLIESQGQLAHFEESRIARDDARKNFLRSEEFERKRMMMSVIEWLAPADAMDDHEKFKEIRSEYPNTGRWLLKALYVKKWLDPLSSDVPVIWLYGISGAGKTILASMLLEEVKKRSTAPLANTTSIPSTTIVFFYCKHEDPDKNTLQGVTRSLIAQFVRVNPDIIPLIDEERCLSGVGTLTSRNTAEKLLDYALKGTATDKTYILVDGLDECRTIDDMKKIIVVLTNAVQALNQASPGTCRLLFTSTNEQAIKLQMQRSQVKAYSIRHEDNKHDMEQYIEVWAAKIQKKFDLPTQEWQDIEKRVLSNAKGMFLYCVLVCCNLLEQPTRAELEFELRPETFPSGLKDAYLRIIDRIKRTSIPRQNAAFKILGLLAFARRPLKYHEIQGFFIIDEKGTVDYAKHSLRDDVKELCGSLVEVRGNNIELVHNTVKIYLTQERLLHMLNEERTLAMTCIRHLSSICYNREIEDGEVENFTRQGYYALLEYASIYWLDHVQSYASSAPDTSSQAMTSLLHSYLAMYWNDNEEMPPPFSAIEDNSKYSTDFAPFQSQPEIYKKLVYLASITAQVRAHTLDPSAGALRG